MNVQFGKVTQTTPDITIPGEIVEKIMILLNNTAVFVKTHDGIMRPFVDPLPINQHIMACIQTELQKQAEQT